MNLTPASNTPAGAAAAILSLRPSQQEGQKK